MNPSPNSGFWSPSSWYLAQVTHLLAGPVVLFAGVHHGWSILWIIGVFVLVTAVKEFVIDLSTFEGDTIGGSMEDFGAYQVGMVGALVTLTYFWIGVAVVVAAIVVVFLIDLHTNADW